MAEDTLNRRLPLYAYLESLLSGRRVLEVGRSSSEALDALRAAGARVVTAEGDGTGVVNRFDVVLVPEGEALVRRPGLVSAWRKLLADPQRGRVIVMATNADRAGAKTTDNKTGGLGYYELHDALAPHFPGVQMLGLTPFLGMGVVEFEGAVDGLRIDARLVKEGSEPPVAYVAVAGVEPAVGLGYALVQLPFGVLEPAAAPATTTPGAAPAPAAAPSPTPGAAPQALALLREEVEELRGRLRRAAEDRATQDAEVAAMRKALAEADQTVINLTRRTTEEMAAVAERLASGFRSPAEVAATTELAAARDDANRLRVRLAEAEARAAAAEQRLEEIGAAARERQTALDDAQERLRLADSELARARRTAARFEEEARAAAVSARDSEQSARALTERDERIAALEVDKQDLSWRLAELEDKLRDAIARALRSDAGRSAAPAQAAAPSGDVQERVVREARERMLEDFKRAGSAHIQEVTELKAALSEQSALVAELEDGLAVAEARAAGAGAEATTFRKSAKDMEEADRTRRSRLAELEGKLLRLEHERKQAVAAGAETGDAGAREREEAAARQIRALEVERDSLRSRIEGERAAWTRERDVLRGNLDEAKRTAQAGGSNGHNPDSRVANTLGNYRELAGRMRDDIEGVRRRLESLSPAEVAGFLEELGEDLAELERQ